MKTNTFITALFKTFALVLVVVIMFPSLVKLSHSFSYHTHQVCDNDTSSNTHFHQADIDCEFCKFKLTTQYYFQNKLVILAPSEENFKIIKSQYDFVSDFQKLQTALRGPPQLI